MSGSEPDPIQVGVLGVGAISQIVYLPILSEREDADVVALADADRPKADTLANRFDVPKVFSDTPYCDILESQTFVDRDLARRASEERADQRRSPSFRARRSAIPT